MLCAKSLAENDKQGMGGLQWFHEMKWADYPCEFCAEEYSDKLETWHSSCHCHNCHQQMQSSSQSESESRPTFEDELQQLDNALLPLKADLLNSCVTYANHIEALANFSVDIRDGLSKALANQAAALQQQVTKHVQMTIPSVTRVMSLAYLWLADSFDMDNIANAQLQRSALYPHATGRSLICVNNSCCVVHTVNGGCTRLIDNSRGCLIIAKAHKKLDINMKFLARTLYYIVHGIPGEEWFDLRLANGRVFHTKKNDARKLIRTQVKLNATDTLSLAAFDAAEAAGLCAKNAARALRAQAAGGSAAGAAGGGDHDSCDDEDAVEGTSPNYAGLDARSLNHQRSIAGAAAAAPAPAQREAAGAAPAAAPAPAPAAPAPAAPAPAAGGAGAGAGGASAGAAAAGAGAAPAPVPALAPLAPAPAQAEASQQGAGGPLAQGAGPAPGRGQAGRRQRGRADWAAAHEPREAPTERLADLAEWVKKLATAVSSAFSALSRTGKLQQVPRACARGGWAQCVTGCGGDR